MFWVWCAKLSRSRWGTVRTISERTAREVRPSTTMPHEQRARVQLNASIGTRLTERRERRVVRPTCPPANTAIELYPIRGAIGARSDGGAKWPRPK